MKDEHEMKRSYGFTFCAVVLGLVGCGTDATQGSSEVADGALAPLAADGPLGATEETATEENVSAEESIPATPAEVVLAWSALARPGSIVASRGTTLQMELANTTDQLLGLHLVLTGDDGGPHSQQIDLGDVRLEAGATQSLTVDVAQLRLALEALAYSGRLHVTALVHGADGQPRHASISAPVFFHAAGGATGAAPALMFYDEVALKDTFHRGDYRGTIRGLDTDPEYAGLLRVADIGTGNATGDAAREVEATLAREEGAAAPGAEDGAAQAGTPRAGGALNSYETCALFRTQTTDSGIPVGAGPNKGGVEDYFKGWNVGQDVPAYGARVVMSQGSWSQSYDADPLTGCFTWKTERTGSFNMKVYAFSRNARGNYARVHNDVNDFSALPGTAYWNYFTGFKPVNGGKSYIAAGNYSSEFTAAAIMGFVLRRLGNLGPKDAHFEMAIDNKAPDAKGENGAYSSAHWGQSNSFITEGRHYLRVANIGATRQSQEKFVVAHEMGHAFAAVYYGSFDGAKNGSEPKTGDYAHPVGAGNGCGMADLYSIGSEEWNSVLFREGFAHFLSAFTWNNQEEEGSFDWLGSHHDLERYSNGAGLASGGRLENVCATPETYANAGTNEDWMLFFWDYFTNSGDACTTRPTPNQMLKLYANTRLGGGLTTQNYFQKMRAAAKKDASLPSCVTETRFDQLAKFNGIDN